MIQQEVSEQPKTIQLGGKLAAEDLSSINQLLNNPQGSVKLANGTSLYTDQTVMSFGLISMSLANAGVAAKITGIATTVLIVELIGILFWKKSWLQTAYEKIRAGEGENKDK